MLWNDSRYRSSFMQIIALFGLLLVLLYVFDNVRDNLAALGKTFGFSFMGAPSSYDINQKPIHRCKSHDGAIVGRHIAESAPLAEYTNVM